MSFDVTTYARRLYKHGHRPEDFNLRLAPHLCIVSPVRAPKVIGGIELAESATEIPGQFALSHRIEALPDHGPDGVFIFNGTMPLRVGDIIKAREAHLDPIQRNGDLCSLPLEHIVGVIATVVEVEGAAAAE